MRIAKHVVVRPVVHTNPPYGAYHRPRELEYVVPEHVESIRREPDAPFVERAEWWRPSPIEGAPREFGPRLDLFTLHVGSRAIHDVEGPLGKLHRHLFGASPEADETGVSIRVMTGSYTLGGDGEADRVIEAGQSAVLDPERVTGPGGEWTLTRPPSSPAHRYEIAIGETTTFTLQRWQQPEEPGGDPFWADIEETTELQTTARLRPKPRPPLPDE